ncbi:NAD(P)H-quinone oxidoreductase subunit S, chloroplastic [Glycine soja]
MSSFVALQGLHGSLLSSQFLGQDTLTHFHPHNKASSTIQSKPTTAQQPSAKFDMLQILGGRGLCNGEAGLKQELKKQVGVDEKGQTSATSGKEQEEEEESTSVVATEDGFEKELMGLTGGFPGGMIAIVKNPNNPFYMYCKIVQRITDGKAGVLFEGRNWDRLITFTLEELE